MLAKFVEYSVDLFSVCRFVVCGVDENVVHIDSEPVFSEFFGEYRVHHRLECGGGVCESEEHDSWFEQSLVSDEGCLPFVSFLNADVVVSPPDVELRE